MKTLLERFTNPAIGDQLSRLCLDGGSKIPGNLIFYNSFVCIILLTIIRILVTHIGGQSEAIRNFPQACILARMLLSLHPQ